LSCFINVEAKNKMDKDTILARWMAGEITDAEFKTMVSDDDFRSFVKLRKAINLYEATQTDLPDNLLENIKAKTKRPKKIFKLWQTAVAVAAVVLLFFTVNKYLTPSTFAVETAYGEHQKLTLPDGTMVWLEANSKLSYDKDNWQQNKQVNLSGSAYFELNNNNRLSVVTPSGKLSAQAGKFEVTSISDLFKVVNFDSQIQAQTIEKNFEIAARQSLVKYKKSVFTNQIPYTQPDIIAKEIRLNQIPLTYVLQELTNLYGVTFENKGVDTEKLFTGTLPTDNLKLSMAILVKTMQIKYSRKDSHTLILKP
jgi:ferric-dicitrate binding protein FerR (iron transport regulator)